MDKINSSLDDINSAAELSWVNSDLYNLDENATDFQVDRNPTCNVKTNSSIVVHSQMSLNESETNKVHVSDLVDPNIQRKWSNPKSKSVTHQSQGKTFFYSFEI